ncbi:ferritin family protein [uncultured Clostridium sp.]|uniref:rubrerythrin family protein n=1 Tax=uncultured Clostridium sp. TaxID=59620 RepID=UPI002606009B|nr:ferritin family protein [uncultured Clostridium sp.]
MSSLETSQTLQNLISSMVRESQVSTSYYIYSQVALTEGFWDISEIFSTIANQENEHYKVFLNFIPSDVQQSQSNSQASVIISKGTTAQNIVSSLNNEIIATTDYPQYATVATNEGFPEISTAFTNIYNIERYHHSLFEKLQYNLLNNEVFQKDRVVLWQCQACGFIIESIQVPSPCPVCYNVGSYKYLGDEVVLYMGFKDANQIPKTIIVENKDPATSIEDVNTEMDSIITNNIEGPSLTKDNYVITIQQSQRYNMQNEP